MEGRGNYSEAEDFRRGLEQHGYNEYDHVYRGQEADGMAHTYVGDCAERAAEELRYQERREERRLEEEDQRREDERNRQILAERQQEEEYYEQQFQQSVGQGQ
jgi:hypothetical protein